MWLNLSEYGRVRGVSSAAVKKAILQGRLHKSVRQKKNGKWEVNAEAANIEWQINTKPPGIRETAEFKSPDPESLTREQIKANALYDSRATLEDYKAKLAKVEYEERIGHLVDVEIVKEKNFKLARAVRDAMITIPDRIAAEIAGISDTVLVHKKLTDEIRRAIAALQP